MSLAASQLHAHTRAKPTTAPHSPLALACTVTVHKSQGATLDFVLADMANALSPGQLYAAISRVGSRQHLRILHRPLASACTPLYPSHGVLTLADSGRPCLHFLASRRSVLLSSNLMPPTGELLFPCCQIPHSMATSDLLLLTVMLHAADGEG